jgi:hypothetical protein
MGRQQVQLTDPNPIPTPRHPHAPLAALPDGSALGNYIGGEDVGGAKGPSGGCGERV